MTIEEIAEVLTQASLSAADPLKEGMRRRSANTTARRNGDEVPYPYRDQWLTDTARAIIKLLGEQASGFNDTNVGDRISSTDLMDSVINALNLLWIQAGGVGIENKGRTLILK